MGNIQITRRVRMMIRLIVLLGCVCTLINGAHVRKFTDNDIATVSQGGPTDRVFLKLYAPWCGHCKVLAPVWESLAASLQSNDDIIIGSVDCTTEVVTRQLFEVASYPTLVMVVEGQVYKYKGGRDEDSLRKFVTGDFYTQSESSPMYPELEPEIVSDVDTLTATTFIEDVQRRPAFVRFFSPHCGKSARQAPSWEQFGKQQFPLNVITVAEVDCTKNKLLCTEFKVAQYPKLVFITGETVYDYTGPQNVEGYNRFATSGYKVLNGRPLKSAPLPDTVVDLTPRNFEENLMNHPGWVVYFTAPSTKQGKELDRIFDNLANDYSHAFTSGRFDCEAYRSSCDILGVSRVPEIRLVFGVNQFTYPDNLELTQEEILEWVTRGKFRDVPRTQRASLLGKYQLTMDNWTLEAALETVRRNYVFVAISSGIAILYGLLLFLVPCCAGGRKQPKQKQQKRSKKSKAKKD